MQQGSSRIRVAAGVAVGLAGAAIVALYLRRRQRSTRLRVSKLAIYPIKGCKGVRVPSAKVLEEGLEHDREFMIVRPGGGGLWEFVSQRQIPGIALIEPSVPSADGALEVRAPGMPPLTVRPPGEGANRVQLNIWGDAAEGLDCGDAAAAWLCELLQAPGLRLLRHAGVRRIDEAFAKGRTMFSDGFPLLVTTEASLADVEAASGLGRPFERFRPNLVLEGAGRYAEDAASGIVCSAGGAGVRLRFVKPCARCQVPAVDPATGSRGRDPLPAIKPYRSGKILASQATAHPEHYQTHRGEIFFGQNAVPELGTGQNVVSEGDDVAWM